MWNRFRALGGPEHFARSDSLNKIEFEMGKVIWDFIAVFPPGSDRPSITAAPVVQGIDEIRAALAKLLSYEFGGASAQIRRIHKCVKAAF